MTLRLDRMQRGLFEAFSGVAGRVLWAHGQPTFEQLPSTLLELSLTAGPSPGIRQHQRGTLLSPADSVIVRVTAATVGTRNIVRLNDYDYRRDVAGGDTVTDIRDALLADIQSGEAGAVTATADGTDGIQLVADFRGGLRDLRLLGDLEAQSKVFSGDDVLVTEGTVTSLVTVQAFSKAREIRTGATSIISEALARVQDHDTVEDLTRYGVALWGKSGVTNLSSIAGANWETRAAFDLTVASRQVTVAPVDRIETATMTIQVGAATVPISASAP